MHELGIVFSILDRVEEVVKEENLSHVYRIVMEIGEVSTVIPSYLKDCFRWAADKRELFKGAELECETIKAVTYCNNCCKEYSTVEFGITCPYCGSRETELLVGSEVNIKEIAAE